MRDKESYGYISHGPIPQNEYTTANPDTSADSAAAQADAPTPDEVAYKRHLKKRQLLHPAGRRKILGWSRPWKANGWRAESAARHDESTDLGRHTGDDQKNNPTF